MSAWPRSRGWNVIAGRPVTVPARRRTPDPVDQCGPRVMLLLIALTLASELALLVHMDWLPW